MNRKSLVAAAALMLVSSGAAFAQQKCTGVDIANGPFAYSAATNSSGSFNGTTPNSLASGFSVTAPSPSQDRPAVPNVFPGQGQDPCLGVADTHVHVHEIMKIEDANGNPITPVEVLSSDPLFQTLASKFQFSLKQQGVCGTFQSMPLVQFTPGDQKEFCVQITNPNLQQQAELGKYMFWMKAHAPGAGIGTGPGAVFTLDLNLTAQDVIPPAVSINKPFGDQILGVLPIEITATDPAPGTGVASMSASLSSTGGAISNQALALIVAGLPQGSGAAGTPVTATSSFTPFGGTGTAGTTMGQAFTSSNRSGIGTYLINAQATDGAGNTGFASSIFKVKYELNFTQSAVPNGCTAANVNPCNAMYQMKARRSNATSDGAFMFDTTVVLKLVRTSDNVVVSTHACNGAGCTGGAPHNFVQIDETNKLYKTQFKHNDIDLDPNTPGVQAPASINEYRVDVYFMDVDGNMMFQGSSQPLTF